MEFAERCAAVAQGVEHRTVREGRGRGALPRHAYVVTSVAAGTGRTGEEAETAALGACEQRQDGRRAVCLVAASARGGGGRQAGL